MHRRQRRAPLRVERLALPVGHRLARRWRVHADVQLAVLDRIDEAPAIGRDARVEAHVDVGLAYVASEDERGAGLLRGRIAVTRYVEQYACDMRRQRSGERRSKGAGGNERTGGGGASGRTDEDKLDGRDLRLEAAEGGVELLAAGELPETVEGGRHGVLEGGTGPLVRRHEPLFEFGGGGDALGGGEPRAAVHELRGVVEGAAAGVVKVDEVDESAVDRHVRFFEVRDVVRPGRGDGLQLFGGR